MKPLVIAHPQGQRTLLSYRVPANQRGFAIRPEPNRGGVGHVVLGDRRETPGGLPVHAWLAAGTPTEAYALAYKIVAEAEHAVMVSTHLGERMVDGLLSYAMQPDGNLLRLTLEFAPVGSAFADGVRLVGVATMPRRYYEQHEFPEPMWGGYPFRVPPGVREGDVLVMMAEDTFAYGLDAALGPGSFLIDSLGVHIYPKMHIGYHPLSGATWPAPEYLYWAKEERETITPTATETITLAFRGVPNITNPVAHYSKHERTVSGASPALPTAQFLGPQVRAGLVALGLWYNGSPKANAYLQGARALPIWWGDTTIEFQPGMLLTYEPITAAGTYARVARAEPDYGSDSTALLVIGAQS